MMNGATFDEQVFARMMALAESVLEKAEPLPGTQAIVLETVAGNEFAAEIPDALSESHVYEGALLEQLELYRELVVKNVLCVWADGGVDLPSMAFRKMLCELSPENLNAAVFLRTKDGYTVKPMGVTMK